MKMLLALAAVKLLVGVVAGTYALLEFPTETDLYRLAQLTFVLSFGAAAVLLMVGGRNNPATTSLGALFLVGPSPFAGAILNHVAPLSGLSTSVLLFHYLQIDAFTPFLLWKFVGAFPRVDLYAAPRLVLRVGTRVSLAAGWFLFVANLLMYEGRFWAPLSEDGALGFFRHDVATYHFPVQWILMIAAFAVAAWKTTRATTDEKRRVTVFFGVFAFGLAPLMLLTSILLTCYRLRWHG